MLPTISSSHLWRINFPHKEGSSEKMRTKMTEGITDFKNLAGGVLSLSWFMVNTSTIVKGTKKSSKITYWICIVRQWLNGRICAQEYPHRLCFLVLASEQPSLFCKAKTVKPSSTVVKKKKNYETCRFTLTVNKDTELIAYTCIISNGYLLTSIFLLPKLRAHLNAHSWPNCLADQK